jgi:DNA replication and repair protein RecF
VVSSRNALLKQLNERSGDPQQLDYWDANLAELGARIIYTRIQAIKELEQFAKRLHQDLTRSQEILRMNYQPSFDPLPDHPGQYAMPLEAAVDRSGFSVEEIAAGFQSQLINARADEIARGVTTTGPHRDDLRFLGNGVDLGVYGSRGQVRTTLLTLKLAEVSWMKEKTGHWPIVLLDEVLAELDITRREDLLARVVDCRQAMLTTTDLNLFKPDFVDQSTLWTIAGGRLTTT